MTTKRASSSSASDSNRKSKRRATSEDAVVSVNGKPNRPAVDEVEDGEESTFLGEPVADDSSSASDSKRKSKSKAVTKASSEDAVVLANGKRNPPAVDEEEDGEESTFIGDPVADACQRWPHRYTGEKKGAGADSTKGAKGKDDEEIIQARRHFTQAKVDGRVLYNIGDDAHVKGEEGKENYICKIVEMFEGVDGLPYFTAQWFYRAKDTVIQACYNHIDNKRVFFSEVRDDNALECLVERLKIVQLPQNLDLASRKSAISHCDYYCDMKYLLPYFSFVSLPPDNVGAGSESSSTISSEGDVCGSVGVEVSQVEEHKKSEIMLLDMYSGCGAMSTGICLGANSSGVNLVAKWAVDLNQYACASLKLNHPETEVRNESAEDFLCLLKEWEKLCASFSLIAGDCSQYVDPVSAEADEGCNADDDDDADDGDDTNDGEVFEVEEVLAICHGDPKEMKKPGLYLKIRWKGYGPEEDTWEPIEGLSDCRDKIKDFVTKGYKSKILPLPGGVDVICGGPPCQGISGFNRFRNKDNPLEDPKNKQLSVFMDIVDYLKPRFVLMENVVDIVKFAGGFLGRYALSRLIGMNYQARLGMMAAGAYGLPQFRMRVFLWGARFTEKLPQYPLPSHHLIVRGVIPTEFESCTVAYEEGNQMKLEKELFLGDALSDLPPVENNEARDEMPYGDEPKTEFQKFIRLRKDEMPGSLSYGSEISPHVLFDHRPLQLNDDDYQRVCHIPKRKGANFRDLKGVRVRDDNKVEWDPNVERVYLASGKPLVPDYAMSFVGGTSSKPFGRLWWDETVPTVVTRAEPHNQTIVHPLQDRVLTIRENARLQGFPDYYKLIGPIKERYIQVGNAVAVPVARGLGCALAMSLRRVSGEEPLFTLPEKFPHIVETPLSPVVDEGGI